MCKKAIVKQCCKSQIATVFIRQYFCDSLIKKRVNYPQMVVFFKKLIFEN